MSIPLADYSDSKPVRLRDIAKLAGVHITAVSAVLSPRANTRTRVSEQTAERIRELATRLNYQPHLPAQMMRKRRSGIVGLLEFGRSDVSSQRTTALAKALRSRGCQVLSTNVLWFNDAEEAINSMLNAQVEGVILIMLSSGISLELIHRIQNAGIACVAFNGVHPPGIPQVRSAIEEGLTEITTHLLNLGCQRLALVNAWSTKFHDINTCWPTLERIAGFESAIKRANGVVVKEIQQFQEVPITTPAGVVITKGPGMDRSDIEIGYEATKELLASGETLDALVCGNDRYAFGALRACYEAGVKVPDEMAIVGFNGESNTRFFCPSLTTVDILNPSDADTVIELLLQLMNKEQPLNSNLITRLPCRLIVRDSCGSKLGKRQKKFVSN